MSIRIILADDHRIIREGLRSLIEKQPDMEVVAEAADGRTAVQLAQQLQPDVVIMDIAMPDLNGIQATRQITGELRHMKVIALSMHIRKRFVAEMFKAGATGYLLKNCAFEELEHAIRTVVANQTYVSPGIAGSMVEDYVNRWSATESSVFSVLSDRETEVLQLLAEGKSTKEIASHLGLSVKTLETHRRRIMDKLDIDNLAELIKYAVREELTTLGI